MANYKESKITGTTYVRAHEVTVRNPLSGDKGICFAEEKVSVFGEQSMREHIGAINEPFTAENAETEFPLLDSTTGEPTGKVATYRDVYQLLCSLYYALASTRDTKEVLAVAEKAS